MEFLFGAAGGLVALVLGTMVTVRFVRRRDLRKKAQTRLEWGDLPNAARLFQQAGDLARAASLFRDAGERLKACEAQVALIDFDAAIDVLRGGRPEEIEAGARLLTECKALVERGRAGSLAGVARNAGLAAL
jgi:hypothetical protein